MLYDPVMIIACPACATRYAVPDSALGIEGRTVRCAKCRHAWFQEGPSGEQPAAAPSPAPVAPAAPPPPPSPAPAAAEQPAEAPDAGADAQAEAEPPLGHEAARSPRIHADEESARADEDGPSSFAYEPPFRPRRNPAKLWMAMAIGFAIVVFATMAAVARFGLPAWVPLAHTTFAPQRPDLKLDFPPGRQERRPLPNGTDFFNVSGTITNVGQQRRVVPMLLIVLRDRYNRIVYSLEAAPSRGVLAPGESESVNQAIIDAPKSARTAEIGWKPD